MEKILEPQTIQEQPLPSPISYYEITDAPQTLKELSPVDGTALATATTTIGSLGDLAFKDLVNTLDIAALAVTNAKIAVDAIQGAVIAAGAITETKIASDAISTPKIAAGAITTLKIAAGAVTANEIAANTITAAKIAANTITADRMNVSSLSAISANIGAITAGTIDGLTITGGTIRTSSGTTRVQMDGSTNELQIYSSSVKRMRAYDQGLTFWDSSGNNVADIYAGSIGSLLITTQNSGATGRSIYISAGSTGVASLGISSSSFMWADGSLNMNMFARHLQPSTSGIDLGGHTYWLNNMYSFKLNLDTTGYVNSGGSTGTPFPSGGGWSVTHLATGRYQVNHPHNTTNYTVAVNPVAGAAKVWAIESRSAYSFTVRIGNLAGSLEDNDFMFHLIFNGY